MLVIYLVSNYVIRSICLSLPLTVHLSSQNHQLFSFLPDIKQKDGDLGLTHICAAGHQTPLKQQARQQFWCEDDSQSNCRT